MPEEKNKKPWIYKGVTKNGVLYTRYRVSHKVVGESEFVKNKDSRRRGKNKLIKPFKSKGIGGCLFVTDFGQKLSISSFNFYPNPADSSKISGSNNHKFSLSAKNGKVIVYSISDGKVKNKSTYFFSRIGEIFKGKATDKRLKAILEIFLPRNGIFFNKKLSGAANLKNSIFPMNEFVNLDYVDSFISREVASLKIDDFCKKMTGCKGKKTKEMLKGAPIGRLQFLKLFKGLIPIDTLNGDLKTITANGRFPTDIKINKVRKFLKNFSPERLKIMARAYDRPAHGFWVSTLTDTVRMWNDYAGQLTLPDQPRDFDFLHDTLSAQIGRKSKSNIPLKINSKISKVNNQTINHSGDEYFIRMPEDSFELANAGAALHNCLGSYTNSVNRGDVSILLVSKNNALSHAISLNPSGDKFAVQQFVADRNSPPKDTEKGVILGFLKENELIN